MTRIFQNSQSKQLRHEGVNCYLQMTWPVSKVTKQENKREKKTEHDNDRTTAYFRCDDAPSSIPVLTFLIEDRILSIVVFRFLELSGVALFLVEGVRCRAPCSAL